MEANISSSVTLKFHVKIKKLANRKTTSTFRSEKLIRSEV